MSQMKLRLSGQNGKRDAQGLQPRRPIRRHTHYRGHREVDPIAGRIRLYTAISQVKWPKHWHPLCLTVARGAQGDRCFVT